MELFQTFQIKQAHQQNLYMINCIYVKDNNICESKIKNISEDIIFKKCHYKNSTDFTYKP